MGSAGFDHAKHRSSACQLGNATCDGNCLLFDIRFKGQFEFANAGFCMNDEAGVSDEAIITQMTVGHEFIKRTFGVTPRIGWTVDPFGHSSTMASLYAQMGFSAVFFARIGL